MELQENRSSFSKSERIIMEQGILNEQNPKISRRRELDSEHKQEKAQTPLP